MKDVEVYVPFDELPEKVEEQVESDWNKENTKETKIYEHTFSSYYFINIKKYNMLKKVKLPVDVIELLKIINKINDDEELLRQILNPNCDISKNDLTKRFKEIYAKLGKEYKGLLYKYGNYFCKEIKEDV